MLNHVDLMAALTADYLNVYVLRPKEDSADIIKLKGYVTQGITDKPQNFSYSKLLRTYALDRVYEGDRDYFLESLSLQSLLKTFSDGRDFLEFDYRIVEDGEIHYYTARYSRISKLEEELRLVVAFRNIDTIVKASHEQHTNGLYNAYGAISGIFYSLHRVDLQKNSYTTIKTMPSIEKVAKSPSNDYDADSKLIMHALASKWSYPEVQSFIDRSTLEARFSGKNHLTMDFMSYASESCRLHFFKEDEDENGKLHHVIFGVEKIEEEKSNAIINALSREYQNVSFINLDEGYARMIKLENLSDNELNKTKKQKYVYEEVYKEYINTWVHPEDRKELKEAISLEHLRKVFLEKEELNGTYRTVVDKKVHYYHYNFYKLANFNSVIAGFRNIDDIIAQHTEDEQRLREQELAFQKHREEQFAIFDTLAHNFKNVYIVDIKKATAKVLKLEDDYSDHRLDNVMNIDFPYEPFLNEWISEAVLPEDKGMLSQALSIAHLREVFKEKEEYIGNYRMLVKGQIIHYQFSISLMQDKAHLLAGFQNVDAIIKEHLEEEKKRQEKEQAYQAQLEEHLEIFDTLARNFKNVYLADLENETVKILKLGEGYDEILKVGIKRELPFNEVLNYWLQTVVCPEDREEVSKVFTVKNVKELLTKQNEFTGHYRSIVKGQIHHYQYNMSRVNLPGMKAVLGFQNIDAIVQEHIEQERKEHEQQEQLSQALLAAQQANKAKSTFLNSMSHDIRTPMNAIIGFTSLAQAHIDNPALVQDYLAKINTSSTHLLNLINDILDMSRIESGTVMLEEKPLHIPELLQDLRTMVQGLVNAKNQKLFLETQDLVHEDVIADKLRLNQVLINIVGNAIKYTPPGGEVKIRLLEKPCAMKQYATYEFSVKDNGIGMSKSFLEHIFESFTREHSSTVTGIQGTGLGMTITKNIVDMMGGTITAESEEGKGSLFTVTLNLQIVNEAVKDKHQTKLGHHNFSGKRALLVEDNALNREIATALLEDAGMKVNTASDGTEAVDIMYKAAEDDYDLIFMDIQMPKMDGYTATHEIRTLANNKKANIPIVAMTANAFEEDRKKSLEAGMNGHIAKPISMEEIAEVLDTIFEGTSFESK